MRGSRATETAIRPWHDVGLPIVVSIGAFCGLNLLWALGGLDRFIPKAVTVYMVGSLLALAFLVRAIRRGTITLEELGLGARGWRPLCRLAGLVVTVLVVTFLYRKAGTKEPLPFGDWCFWFFFLAQASLAEMLIFISLAYCLPARWLKSQGWALWQTILLCGLFASVTFGWHHYTGDPDSHQWAWVTIPVMWVNLAYFIPARNFHLTLLLHNAIAATGFTETQYSLPPVERPAAFVRAERPEALKALSKDLPPADQIAYLADLADADAEGHDKRPVVFAGEDFANSISVAAPPRGKASVSYRLRAEYGGLRAAAVVPERSGSAQQERVAIPLTFRVFGDDRLLWESHPFQIAGTGQTCFVGVAGIDKLTLEVESAADGPVETAWLTPLLTPINWIDPAIYMTPFYLAAFILSFALPYVLLHVLECWATSWDTRLACPGAQAACPTIPTVERGADPADGAGANL